MTDLSQLPVRKQLFIGHIFLFLHIPVPELQGVLGGTACFDCNKFDGHILLHNPDPSLGDIIKSDWDSSIHFTLNVTCFVCYYDELLPDKPPNTKWFIPHLVPSHIGPFVIVTFFNPNPNPFFRSNMHVMSFPT